MLDPAAQMMAWAFPGQPPKGKLKSGYFGPKPEDDPYDPRKSEYVAKVSKHEEHLIALEQLQHQLSALEGSLLHRTTPPRVAEHYRRVASDMRRSQCELAAAVRQGAEASQPGGRSRCGSSPGPCSSLSDGEAPRKHSKSDPRADAGLLRQPLSGLRARQGAGQLHAEGEKPAVSLLDAAGALRTSACLPWARGSTRTTTAGSGEGFPSSSSTSTEYTERRGRPQLTWPRAEGLSDRLRPAGGDCMPLPLAPDPPEPEDPFEASLMVRQRSLGHGDSVLDLLEMDLSDDSDAEGGGGPRGAPADGGAARRRRSFALGNGPEFHETAAGVPREERPPMPDDSGLVSDFAGMPTIVSGLVSDWAAGPPAGRDADDESPLRSRGKAMGASMLNIAALVEQSGAGGASEGQDEVGSPGLRRGPGGGRLARSRSNAMGASMLNIAAYAEQSGAGGASEGEDEVGAPGAPRCSIGSPADLAKTPRARLIAKGPSMLDISAWASRCSMQGSADSLVSLASLPFCGDDEPGLGQQEARESLLKQLAAAEKLREVMLEEQKGGEDEEGAASDSEYAVLCWAPPRRFATASEEPCSGQLPSRPPREGAPDVLLAA